MALVTFIYGDLLILLGVGFYFGTGATSVTALIPAFFGIPLTALGALARNEKLRKHMMHGAAVLGLVGFLATLGGVADSVRMALGAEIAKPAAAVEKTIMCLLSLVFFALTVKSFIDARRRRKAAQSETAS